MLFEKIELEPGEEVLKVVRKHWFIIISELFLVFLLLILPVFLLFILAIFPGSIVATLSSHLPNYTLFVTFCLSAWSVICLMSGFTIWTHYYLDLWIITDRRIILVDQIHFFNRNVSIFRLERLQDIEFYIKGFIPTMLNFGTVRAQTASSFESNFKTSGLPDPRGLQATIQKAMDARLAVLYSNPSATLRE